MGRCHKYHPPIQGQEMNAWVTQLEAADSLLLLALPESRSI